MKVYILFGCNFDSVDVVHVLDSEEKAKTIQDQYQKEYDEDRLIEDRAISLENEYNRIINTNYIIKPKQSIGDIEYEEEKEAMDRYVEKRIGKDNFKRYKEFDTFYSHSSFYYREYNIE